MACKCTVECQVRVNICSVVSSVQSDRPCASPVPGQ